MIKYDDIVKFINRFKYFNSGTEIEKLAVEFKENPDIEEDKVDEIKEEAKEFSDRGVRKSRRELRRLKVIKEKLPWGGKQYEKYLRDCGVVDIYDTQTLYLRPKFNTKQVICSFRNGGGRKIMKCKNISDIHAKIYKIAKDLDVQIFPAYDSDKGIYYYIPFIDTQLCKKIKKRISKL